MNIVVKKASILVLILGLIVSSFTCLCAHEKPVKTAEHECCPKQNEGQSDHSTPMSKDCCLMDQHHVGEAQEVFAFNAAHAIAHDSISLITFELFQPVIVTFKLHRNFHPPSAKLPIYFSKHSFLI